MCASGSPARAAPCGQGQLPAHWERLAATTAATFRLLDFMRRAVPDAVFSQRIATRCRERLTTAFADCLAGRPVRRVGCVAVFARTAEALARRARAPGGAGFTGAAEELSQATFLLRAVNDRAGAPCPCPTTLPSAGDVPALATLLGTDTALRVEPVLPLAPATRYRLVVGLPAVTRATSPVLSSPERLAADALPWMPALPAPVRSFVERTLAAGALREGWTVSPAVLLCLSRPLTLRDLRPRRLRFVPTDDPPPPLGLRTAGGALVDEAAVARATALAGRASARLVDPTSTDAAALGVPGDGRPHLAALVSGSFAAPDPRGGRPVDVPYLVTLPRSPATGVVVLLHSLKSSAAAFLREQADGLAAHGLAAAAFDLPGHGARADGTDFLDPLEPAVVAANLRRAALDAIAFVAVLRTGRLTDRLPAGAPALLGYSTGGVVGTLLLGAEPAMGTAVLVAPAGDVTTLLALQIVAALKQADGGAAAPPSALPAAPCAGDMIIPAALRPTVLATAYRTALADVDPQALAPLAVGPGRRRPILIQEGGRDWIVTNANTELLAAALGADMTCRRRPAAPQVLCRFPELEHNLTRNAQVRAQAHRFLASAGTELEQEGLFPAR